MATIKTAIQIYDGMTRPLQAMSRGMNTLINAMENAQGTFDRGFDSTVLQQVREDIAEATVGFDRMEQNIRQSDHAQDQFNDSIRAGSSAADGLWNKLKGIAATVGGIAGLNKVLGVSDQLTSTNARLNNAMVNFDDGGSLEELQAKVMASAQRSRSYYMDTAAAVAKLGMNARDAFTNMDEVIAFSELVNKSFVIGGAGAQEQSAAMLQLTQAMASGVLRGEELNSIFETAPGIIQSIAKYLDVPIGQIRTMASEGQITANIVKNAMFEAAGDIERTFSNMPKTWGQIWTGMKNKALQVLQPLLNGINWLANNISIIGPAVLGLAGAFAVFQIAAHWTQIAAAATAIYHGVVNFLSIGFGVLTGNTAAASAAVFTFNSALLANPIVWVIMLIMALIGALYAGVAAYNKFTGAGVSATGIIGGAFAVLGAFLINSFIVPLQNGFAMIANFLGNVFNNPIAAVKVAFYDMCLTVIGYITKLAHAIENLLNKIPGVTVDITSGLDSFYAGLEQAQQKVKDEAGWVEYVQKMDFIDYSEAASAGYDFGKGIADKISGAFNLGGVEAFNLGNTLDGIYGNTGDTAGNTAAMSDALDITEEDLSYLRDIAEREAINRFTTAEIKVEQNNTNYIDKETDLDGIMDAWANDFAEKLDVSEEGVHE
ncbi:tape measure protein [Intestinimonas massiliensis (ex Afouda et al. 2020)]|uniref:tape measure protein n=1 Tax=Intestinimonas massiliensis (ex Afouda et al. 2020) TaxID=1673721 RepID=UPI00067F133A|nr:tape measure protein [Intestinimonas massiliensis (ex Afouda et al. 2020)]